jgi:hypothetical protein
VERHETQKYVSKIFMDLKNMKKSKIGTNLGEHCFSLVEANV